MKKILLNLKNLYGIAMLLGIVFMVSCKKYNSLGFDPGTGAPTISTVHTWSKTDTTAKYDTIISYNAAGNMVTTLRLKQARVNAFDSLTTAGNLGNYYLISGTNLGSATNITFNGYSAYFNRALVTDNSIIVQIPAKTPYLPPAANDSLVVTTLYGKAYFKFKILPPPPTPASYSNYNYSPSTTSASQITLNGVGFASVTSVTVAGVGGGTGTTTIVSQNDSVLVLQFNASTLIRGTLVFTYNVGGSPRTANGTQEFVNIDNAYQIFTDNYAPGWGSWSWGPAGPSTAQKKTGTTSFSAQYGANSWWIDGFRYGGGGGNEGLVYSSIYTYLSFWVYGGAADQKIYVEFGNSGFNQNQTTANQYNVPKGVWTYYKIPISNLMWNNTGTTNWAVNSSQPLNTVAFFMNSNNAAEQIYFDDVILVK